MMETIELRINPEFIEGQKVKRIEARPEWEIKFDHNK